MPGSPGYRSRNLWAARVQRVKYSVYCTCWSACGCVVAFQANLFLSRIYSCPFFRLIQSFFRLSLLLFADFVKCWNCIWSTLSTNKIICFGRKTDENFFIFFTLVYKFRIMYVLQRSRNEVILPCLYFYKILNQLIATPCKKWSHQMLFFVIYYQIKIVLTFQYFDKYDTIYTIIMPFLWEHGDVG